ADGTTGALVLVAPVLLELRLAREVQVEMSCPPSRPRRPAEHDAENVSIDIVVDEPAETEQLSRGLRREPGAQVTARALGRGLADSLARRPQLPLEHERVVATRLYLHQQ